MSKVKVNVYNKSSERAVRKQLRDNRGRFSKRLPKIIFYLSLMVAVLAIVYLSQRKPEIKYVEKENTIVINTTQQIIDKEKSDILDALEQCESKGDANAIVWVDGGTGKNTASFGAYMFKVGTIQGFIKGLTEFQAIALASDKVESRKLAEHIIFETKDGWKNWFNCSNKNNLLGRVNFVIELQSKISK
jgi:hypothetical protein